MPSDDPMPICSREALILRLWAEEEEGPYLKVPTARVPGKQMADGDERRPSVTRR